jgi:hypothetical protein
VLALIELSLNIEFTNWMFADIHKDLKLNEDGIISGELIINDYEEN